MSKITVVGSFVIDMVATMDRFPQAGESIIGKQLKIYLGGKGANQCVAVKRLGGDAEMIGCLGNDGNGESFKKMFREENIKIDNIFTVEEEPTAVAQVQIDKNSQNRICVIPGSNYCFNSENLKSVAETIKNSDIVITQLELLHEVTFELIDICYKYNVPIILNPAPAIKLSDEVLSKITYLTPNETELALISGMSTETDKEVEIACKKLLKLGVKCIVATLGSKGAYIYDNKGGRLIKGYDVKAIDTVAAGDSFNGALAVALTEGKSIDEAVSFGNAMGALTVQVKGAIPSLHTRNEVDEFIKEHRNVKKDS